MAGMLLTIVLQDKIKTLGFKEHYENSGKKISNAEAVGDYKVGKAPNNMLKYYMNKLVIKMPAYGFIQHYGVSGIRGSGSRTRHKPRTTTYDFRYHNYNLPAKDYIDKAISRSKVVPFVMENITKIRGKEIMVSLKNFIEKE